MRWGELSVAIATVGLCRWLVERTWEYLGKSVIEIDTDGLMVSEEPDIDAINSFLNQLIMDTFKLKSSMELELEYLGKGFFLKAKNYILEDEGEMTLKGAIFKSSRYSGVYNRAMKEISRAVMDGVEDVWPIVKGLKDFSSYRLDDYIMSASVKQPTNEYANPNALQPRLARQAMDRLDTEIGEGDSIDYVVARGRQYTIASLVSSTGEIDTTYYENEIDKVLDIFGLAEVHQLDLFNSPSNHVTLINALDEEESE